MISTKTKRTPEEVKHMLDEMTQVIASREFECAVLETDIERARGRYYRLALLVDWASRIDPQKIARHAQEIQEIDDAWHRIEANDEKLRRVQEKTAECRIALDKANALYAEMQKDVEKKERRKRKVKT